MWQPLSPSLPYGPGTWGNWKYYSTFGHTILTLLTCRRRPPEIILCLSEAVPRKGPERALHILGFLQLPPIDHWLPEALIRLVCKTGFHLWRLTQVSEQGKKVWHHPCLHLCWVANEITWWIWGPLKSMLILIIIKSTFKFTAPWGRLESIIFHRCVHCSGF